MEKLKEALKGINDVMENYRWQSIETAPKDRVIFGYDIESKNQGCVQYNKEWELVGAEWELVGADGSGLGIGFFPTHWMPLPEPPNEK